LVNASRTAFLLICSRAMRPPVSGTPPRTPTYLHAMGRSNVRPRRANTVPFTASAKQEVIDDEFRWIVFP
jgi:hypothetical protein